MEINNLNSILKLLEFPCEHTFYHLQILKRRKENPELNRNSTVIKTYYITSHEYLENKMEEIIEICKFFNARAYINLNPRNFEKIAYHNLKKITDCILNKDFKSIRKSYESVCGNFGQTNYWIIDVDVKDFDQVLILANQINKCKSKYDVNVVTYIETINGWHIIVRPFDIRDLPTLPIQFDIQKNNPTILYYDLSVSNSSIDSSLVSE